MNDISKIYLIFLYKSNFTNYNELKFKVDVKLSQILYLI